jgi:hypothetical protein
MKGCHTPLAGVYPVRWTGGLDCEGLTGGPPLSKPGRRQPRPHRAHAPPSYNHTGISHRPPHGSPHAHCPPQPSHGCQGGPGSIQPAWATPQPSPRTACIHRHAHTPQKTPRSALTPQAAAATTDQAPQLREQAPALHVNPQKTCCMQPTGSPVSLPALLPQRCTTLVCISRPACRSFSPPPFTTTTHGRQVTADTPMTPKRQQPTQETCWQTSACKQTCPHAAPCLTAVTGGEVAPAQLPPLLLLHPRLHSSDPPQHATPAAAAPAAAAAGVPTGGR